MSALRASSATMSDAPLICAPPPTKIAGFFAPSINAAICLSVSSDGSGAFARGFLGTGSNSYSAPVTSLVMSMSTGPGLPLSAISNALRTVGARSSTLRTTKLCLVMGIVMPAM